MKRKTTFILCALLLTGILTSGCMPEVMRLYSEGSQSLQEGKFHEALTLWEEELRLFREQENLSGIAEVLGNIGAVYSSAHQYQKASSYIEEALRIYRKMKEPAGTAFTLSNLGTVYQKLGQYDKALSYYRASLDISVDFDIAQMLKHPVIPPSGRERMKKYFEQAIPNLTSSTLQNIGTINLRLGNYEEALANYKKALTYKDKCGCPKSAVIYQTGLLFLAQKNYEKAEEAFVEAQKDLKENIRRTAGINLSLAEVYLKTNRHDKALTILKESFPLWYDTDFSRINYYTIYGIALKNVGRLNDASGELLKAVSISEEMRSRVESKAEYFGRDHYLRAYKELVSVLSEKSISGENTDNRFALYGSNTISAAFYFSESTKARTLLEAIASSAKERGKTELPADIDKREKNILGELSMIESQWEDAYKKGEDSFKRLGERKDGLKKELDSLVAFIRKEHPLYAALNYPKPMQAEELPLKDNEVLIEYALTDDASYAFVVRKGGVKNLIRIPMAKETLEEKIKAFMEPLNTGQHNLFSVKAAKGLYAILLSDALKDITPPNLPLDKGRNKEGLFSPTSETKLIIIPDGILGLLPFEALVINEGKDIKDSLYVGDRFSITYSQSATALALTRMLKPSQAAKPIFALGNPVFDKEDPRYIAFKKGQQPALLAQNTTSYAYRGITLRPKEIKISNDKADIKWEEAVYSPLPETETEVKDIAKLFNTKPEFPDILININANETSLKKVQLKDYKYLHFATHADLPGKVQGINEPFLLLGQVENEKQDDGFLTLSEVLGLSLDADMAVLSACVTGKGKIMEGEGVANLARAFQHAGSRSVVVSLWEVPSKETVEYMKKFYGYIKAGKNRGEALRLARNDIKSKYPNPFYWAVFILHGEG